MPENMMHEKKKMVPFSLPLSRLSIPPFLPLSMSLLSLTSFSLQTTHCEAILSMPGLDTVHQREKHAHYRLFH